MTSKPEVNFPIADEPPGIWSSLARLSTDWGRRAIVAHGWYSTLAAYTPAPQRVSFQQGGWGLIPRSAGIGTLLLVISVAAALPTSSPLLDQPAHLSTPGTDKETKHGYDYSERRQPNLLQGLGNRSASLFPSRLAAICGRLGCTDDVFPGARLPGNSSRSPRTWSLDPNGEWKRNGHVRGRRHGISREARPARSDPYWSFYGRWRGRTLCCSLWQGTGLSGSTDQRRSTSHGQV